MSELDRGAALLHLWKRSWEGAGYAVENYPCRYIEHPALVALDFVEACRHAVRVARGWDEINNRIGEGEVDRLYGRALREGQEILDSRKLWGVRHENGNVSPCETESSARFMVTDESWRCSQLLHRDQPGGDWTVVFDATGLAQDAGLKWVKPGDHVLHDGVWAEVTDRRTENANRDGGPEHNGHDIAAGAVSYVLDLADGRTIRAPYTFDSEPTIRIRRRPPVAVEA
jgi:hypothetical protein